VNQTELCEGPVGKRELRRRALHERLRLAQNAWNYIERGRRPKRRRDGQPSEPITDEQRAQAEKRLAKARAAVLEEATGALR
jgi:hypothetical protein